MAKNIVIFSDGTGQRSGEHFDEKRTNVYKLYRAARCGPDSAIDPNAQFAFYDPGVGTVSPTLAAYARALAWLYNLVCQATGFGLTRNIEDCYRAIVKVYEPGDRIHLIGFSRGAYTVRCLAAVLHFCGVPRTMPDGARLGKGDRFLRKLAKEAVEKVYQHVSWERTGTPREAAFLEQRELLGARFRETYGSVDGYPHFIGVFDTVATVANPASIALASVVGTVLVAVMAGVVAGFGLSWMWLQGLLLLALAVSGVWFVKSHFKIAFDLPGHPWWKTMHMNWGRMRFYDRTLNPKVRFARHALAIDEHRADFDRVPWGGIDRSRMPVEGEPEWLVQTWFAGAHADVGGGYPEPESRLSDAALAWMLEEATSVPGPLLVDRSVLRLHPSPDGMQHDETGSLFFRFAKKTLRPIDPDAPLDATVVARFDVPEVLHLDEEKPYRPENLRGHVRVKSHYR